MVDGARDVQDAIQKVKEDGRRFKVPVVSPCHAGTLEVCLNTEKFSLDS